MEISPEELYPKVGLSIVVEKDGKVLLGKRMGSHGAGLYALPGGSLEYMETISDCVHREIAEEVGIKVENIRFIRIYNLREYAPKHFLDVAVKVDWLSGEPKSMEPDKCESWEWYDPKNIPSPHFANLPQIFECDEKGITYVES